MDNTLMRNEMLTDISALDFMLTDLNQYLDTHPEDYNALMCYSNIRNQYNMLKQQYTESFGPLTPNSTSSTFWNWIDNPWPWDKGGTN